MSILVTAFEPFGGAALNASAAALKKVAVREDVEALLLPVSAKAKTPLLEGIRGGDWKAVLCLGESGAATSLQLERIAVNLRDDDIADNEGVQLVDTPVEAGDVPARFSTLPLRELVQASLTKGVPATISNSAGTFVCNQVMYWAIGAAPEGTPTGFVHLPLMPEQRVLRGQSGPSLAVEHSVKGLSAMLDALGA